MEQLGNPEIELQEKEENKEDQVTEFFKSSADLKKVLLLVLKEELSQLKNARRDLKKRERSLDSSANRIRFESAGALHNSILKDDKEYYKYLYKLHQDLIGASDAIGSYQPLGSEAIPVNNADDAAALPE